MNITRNQEGTTLTIKLDDRLDTVTAPQMDAELKDGLDGVETLIWDFSNLEYITSAGLRTLMNAQRTMLGKENGTMKILHANETVKGVFELTGLDDMLAEE